MATGAPRSPKAPKLHEAVRILDGSGTVIKGAEIDEVSAVARRMAGLDVVVCGEALKANHDLARKIETAVGPWKQQLAHKRGAGPYALPHFQQAVPPPVGHSFYETAKRKARKKP